MELIVESEKNLIRLDNNNLYELESEENEKPRQVIEEKHGVDCKIINNTSNDGILVTPSNLNNGSFINCDLKNSNLEIFEKIEHTPEKENSIETAQKVDKNCTHTIKEDDNDIKSISNTSHINVNIYDNKDEPVENNIDHNLKNNLTTDKNNGNHENHLKEKEIIIKEYTSVKKNNKDIENDEGGKDETENLKNDKSDLNDDKGDLNKDKEVLNENKDLNDELGSLEDELDAGLKENCQINENVKKVKSASKKTEKKKTVETKDEDIKLFDDTDLPLKGTKRDGRGKKKKMEEDIADSWDRVGKISGKIFDEEDEDDAYDYHNHYDYDGDDNDEYTSFKQASMAKKGDRLWMNASGSGKKMKTDPLGRKFIKSALSSEKKKFSERGKVKKKEKSKSQLRRKEDWLQGWENKLRGVENELEGRVGWVRKNEGRIMREERRLAEKEALLGYREQLLLSIPFDNDEGVKKVMEKAMQQMRQYATWLDEYEFKDGRGGKDRDDQIEGATGVIGTLLCNNADVVADDSGDLK